MLCFLLSIEDTIKMFLLFFPKFASGLRSKALQTSCDDFFFRHLNLLLDIHFKEKTKQSVGALNVERVKSLRTFGLVGWSWTAPLHIIRGALDPLTPTHINLAKYRGYYCNVSEQLLLFSFHISLQGGWKLGSLGNGLSHFLYGWISRVTSFTPCLVSLTISHTEHTSCLKIPFWCTWWLLSLLMKTTPQKSHTD